MDQTITINNTPFNVGFSFRSIREYELLTGKSITKCVSTWDNLMFFYATLKAKNPDFSMNVEEFTDYIDENPDLLIQFQTAQASETPPETEAPKKKASTLSQISGFWMLSLLLLALPIWLPLISTISLLWQSLRLLVRLIAKVGKRRACQSSRLEANLNYHGTTSAPPKTKNQNTPANNARPSQAKSPKS